MSRQRPLAVTGLGSGACLLIGGVVGLRSETVVAAICGGLLVGLIMLIGGTRSAAFAAAGVVVSLTPIPWPAPIIVVGVLILLSRSRRAVVLDQMSATARGSLSRRSLLLVLAMGAPTAIVCFGLASKQLHATWTYVDVEQPSLVTVMGVVVLAAILNAVAEEALWRGAIYGWLARRWSNWLAVVVSSLSFGASHWAGLPGGYIGVISATAFGLVMAVVRHRLGLAACVLVHLSADLTLFSVYASHLVFRQ